MAPNDTITIEDAKIAFRNFAGKVDRYNPNGNRSFAIFLEDETADLLEGLGWNVKTRRPTEHDEEGAAPARYLTVGVSYKIRPPRIILLTHNGRTPLDEETVEMMDYVQLNTVDVTLAPYHWEAGEDRGIKAYLRTMYAKIVEDPLDIKYSDQ